MITGISALSGQQIIASGACSARSAATASYTTGGNDIQGLYTTVNSNSAAWAAGTTYTGDAQGALDEVYSKSGDWNTVTSKQAAGDYYSASNPSGFITGVDLTPYQTVEGMTAYQPAGSYLTTADSANFYTTANESGFITGVPAGTMNESEFGYDASDNITGYNGSAFKAGDEFPQSATEAIEVVTSNSAEWNDTTDTVSSNSGAWGGSALPISAGPGIKVNLVDNTLVFSNDETVLYSGTSNTASMTFSESPYNFEKLRFIPGWDPTTNCVSNYVEVELDNASYVSLDFQFPRTDIWNRFEGLYTVADSGMTITQAQYIWGAWGTTTATTNTASKEVRIKKVIGINRK